MEDKKKSVPMVEVRSPPARFIPCTRRAPLMLVHYAPRAACVLSRTGALLA